MKSMKYGSQQKMKAPTMTPSWVAAFFSLTSTVDLLRPAPLPSFRSRAPQHTEL